MKAYFDPFTDTIHNVTDTSSVVYKHEYRHKIQHRVPFIKWFNLNAPTCAFYVSLFFIILFPILHALETQLNINSPSFSIFAIYGFIILQKYLFEICLELDAIIYSHTH